MAERALTPKQEAFCQEYLVDKNATRAAERAGYSARTAAQQGHELLEKTLVQARVKALLATQQKRTEITADRVVKELAKIAFSNIDDVAQWGPQGLDLLASVDVKRRHKAAIKSISFSESESSSAEGSSSSRSTSFAMHDKVQALKLLLHHLEPPTKKLKVTLEDILDSIHGEGASE